MWRRSSTSAKKEKPAKAPKVKKEKPAKVKKEKPPKPAKAPKAAKPVGILVRKPRSSVFTVMLGIAVVAITLGCLFLFLEISQYGPVWTSPWNVRG